MADAGYSGRSQYSGLLVQLYHKIIAMLRRTPRYHKLMYAGDEDLTPRRSRFSVRGKRRVKVLKFESKKGGRPSSAFSNKGGTAPAVGEIPKPRGFRIRRKSVTLPLALALRKVRDAYVNFMMRLASNSHFTSLGGIYGAPGSFDSFRSFDKTDREIIQRLEYLAQSRPSSIPRLYSISETASSENFPRREIAVI